MELLLLCFWIGINGVVGYLIGQKKNAIAESVTLSVLFGPIGWLIAIATRGNTLTCPFCSEEIRSTAVVCRYCGSAIEPCSTAPGTASNLAAIPAWTKQAVYWSLSISVAIAAIWVALASTESHSRKPIMTYSIVSQPVKYVTLVRDVAVGNGSNIPIGAQIELVSEEPEDGTIHIRYEGVVYGIPATDAK